MSAIIALLRGLMIGRTTAAPEEFTHLMTSAYINRIATAVPPNKLHAGFVRLAETLLPEDRCQQGDPEDFVLNFGAMKKDLCQTCHTSSTARQDCLVCHKYHVDGVTTPIMNTKIPTQ